MLKHAKISAAAAPGDSSLVGGPDWNAAHVIAAGTLTPIGIMQMYLNGGTVLGTNRSSRFGTITDNGAGDFSFPVDISGISYEPGVTIDYYCAVSIPAGGALPTGWRVEATYTGGATASISIQDSDTVPADLTGYFEIQVIIYADPYL